MALTGLDLDRATRVDSVAPVQARLTVIGKTRRVAACLRMTTGTCLDAGKPVLTWRFDQQTIDAEAATDGWYALLSDLEADQADATQVLLHYNERTVARFRPDIPTFVAGGRAAPLQFAA